MNEGKPTKAKWWSRPRPVSPGIGEVGPVEDISGPGADRDSDGDHNSDGDHQSERDYKSDGDYELDQPHDDHGSDGCGRCGFAVRRTGGAWCRERCRRR